MAAASESWPGREDLHGAAPRQLLSGLRFRVAVFTAVSFGYLLSQLDVAAIAMVSAMAKRRLLRQRRAGPLPGGGQRAESGPAWPRLSAVHPCEELSERAAPAERQDGASLFCAWVAMSELAYVPTVREQRQTAPLPASPLSQLDRCAHVYLSSCSIGKVDGRDWGNVLLQTTLRARHVA